LRYATLSFSTSVPLFPFTSRSYSNRQSYTHHSGRIVRPGEWPQGSKQTSAQSFRNVTSLHSSKNWSPL
jgi:hypothetical protein